RPRPPGPGRRHAATPRSRDPRCAALRASASRSRRRGRRRASRGRPGLASGAPHRSRCPGCPRRRRARDRRCRASGRRPPRRGAEIGGSGLRNRVAGGTIVNTIYLLSVNGLTIVQGLLLAGLLGAGEYGLWGLLAISFGTLFALAAIGLDDKYIQQDHPDQQA